MGALRLSPLVPSPFAPLDSVTEPSAETSIAGAFWLVTPTYLGPPGQTGSSDRPDVRHNEDAPAGTEPAITRRVPSVISPRSIGAQTQRRERGSRRFPLVDTAICCLRYRRVPT